MRDRFMVRFNEKEVTMIAKRRNGDTWSETIRRLVRAGLGLSALWLLIGCGSSGLTASPPQDDGGAADGSVIADMVVAADATQPAADMAHAAVDIAAAPDMTPTCGEVGQPCCPTPTGKGQPAECTTYATCQNGNCAPCGNDQQYACVCNNGWTCPTSVGDPYCRSGILMGSTSNGSYCIAAAPNCGSAGQHCCPITVQGIIYYDWCGNKNRGGGPGDTYTCTGLTTTDQNTVTCG